MFSSFVNLSIKSHFHIQDAIFLLYICGEHIAKVFSYPSWKCGSFQNLGITEYVSLALTMLYVCVYT